MREEGTLYKSNAPSISYTNVGAAAIDGRVDESYTGDGTTSQQIDVGFRPRVVLVEGSDGTLYEVRDDGLSLIDGATPSGALSINYSGFEVGDGGSDADPNTDTEAYQYVAES